MTGLGLIPDIIVVCLGVIGFCSFIDLIRGILEDDPRD